MRGLAAALVVFVATALAGACSPGPAAPRSTQQGSYTVTAPLFASVADTDAQACFFVFFTYPPQCASGIPVDGVDVAAIAGAQTGRNGINTPSMRLVGTWRDGRLSLTAPPRPAAVTGVPLTKCDGAGPSVNPQGTEAPINEDLAALAARGIIVLMVGMCDAQRVDVIVAVMDAKTSAELERDYGPLTVNGWLTPTS